MAMALSEGIESRPRRIRKLSPAAQDIFEKRASELQKYMHGKWDLLHQHIDSIRSTLSPSSDRHFIREAERRIVVLYGEYRGASRDYCEYLRTIYSEHSLQLYDQHIIEDDSNDYIVQGLLKDLDRALMDAASEKTSLRSKSSSSSSAAVRAKAKAEAAKVRMEFAEQEAHLLKKKALLAQEERFTIAKSEREKQELEADLHVLQEKKLYAQANAEAEVLETLSEWREGSHRSTSISSLQNQPMEDPGERTKRYVSSLNSTAKEISQPNPPGLVQPNHGPPRLNPMATEFLPTPNVTSEISRFLLKKELLFSRLSTFDDTAENFHVWKSSFITIMSELGVTPREELDLLVKWLGNESAKYAKSIRSANAADPVQGLSRVWERLDDCFGSPEKVELAIKSKLDKFPKLGNRDVKQLYELADILLEIECRMENPKYRDLLGYYNTSSGILPILNKLPHAIQQKWTNHAVKYKKSHQVTFPPFTCFRDFIYEVSKVKNDPGFAYDTFTSSTQKKGKTNVVSALKTEISSSLETSDSNPSQGGSQPDVTTAKDALKQTVSVSGTKDFCPLHNANGHNLNTCRTFRSKPLTVRKKFIKDKNLCFKCCKSGHRADTCLVEVICNMCGKHHLTALHIDGGERRVNNPSPKEPHQDQKLVVNSACAQICGDTAGISCSKVVQVNVHPKDRPTETLRTYALIDDQSNRSLVKPDFFNYFDGEFPEIHYSLSSCGGVVDATGRRAEGFVVTSIDGTVSHDLPPLTECTQIPDIRNEIPTPAIAARHKHLQNISRYIPELDNEMPILLLIGRDLTEAHHVKDQRLGPRGSPFAQRLSLGWVIVGETCLGKSHAPSSINCNKTYVYPGGRPSIFPPCSNRLQLKECLNSDQTTSRNMEEDVFIRTPDDDKVGLSIEDKRFLEQMKDFEKNAEGRWSAPLPFRDNRVRLPNNRNQALRRTQNLGNSLRNDPIKRKHFVDFMQNMLINGHAEVAPALQAHEECWYLPVFGVYHPKKKDKIRVVFDSSAKFEGVSLNSILMTGPDLTNSLLGILLRFRREPVGITGDIEQMFYQFFVREEHRNFLRFLWYRDNDITKDIIEYRMCVHVFGNSPSPAIATYGLRKTVCDADSDVREFVHKNFYVDDGLASFPNAGQAVDLMQRTQQVLANEGGLRLHKIVSNNLDVLKAFPKDELAKDVELGSVQRSLGLCWRLETDCFTYTLDELVEQKPFTKRGLLATVNSLFDPLGFVAPIVLQGRILMRNLVLETIDWDTPLSEDSQQQWEEWKTSLKDLEQLVIPRCFVQGSFSSITQKEVHIFCDASEKAISSVAFIRTVDDNGKIDVGFLLGKSKIAPKGGHTIPRLELCGALLAVNLAEIISQQLDLPIAHMRFYTDSKVVLGYLNNQTRRFYVYVENRVNRILHTTESEQWYYVPTDVNPADLGTRFVHSRSLQNSPWLHGPKFLSEPDVQLGKEDFTLNISDQDKEVRPQDSVQSFKTTISSLNMFELGTERFERFSSWSSLVRAISVLRCRILSEQSGDLEARKKSEMFIILCVQNEVYKEEILCLQRGEHIPRGSHILLLDPYVDKDGMLRLGGRLNQMKADLKDKNPLILPGTHHVSTLLVRHYHEKVRHMGRHFTDGAVRSAGIWITGVKRLISSLIHKCVTCRKLRARTQFQKMSDLPQDRLEPAPPFTNVGLDVFGPWQVVARRTRGGMANSKRLAVLYTCLTTRAIHVEIIEELSTSAFINATRRFIAIRGKVSEFRSDRGTNFIGATDPMRIDTINVEDKPFKQFLFDSGVVWRFNSPHSSHMGGVWERMIGVVRRILDSMMHDHQAKDLTHDVLVTFMAEVTAIVNSRPLVAVSTDPDNPTVLSPSMLLTQKTSEDTEFASDLSIGQMYKAGWHRVQALSNMFWKRWRAEYLQTLQRRRKWQHHQRDLSIGDIVLVKDSESHRNFWPMGVVVDTFPSKDGLVRKVSVKLFSKGQKEMKVYTRPVTELVLLIECEL